MCQFQMWAKTLVSTDPKAQSISVPCFVEVMRLMGMESMVGRLAVLKMSWSFFSFFDKVVLLCEEYVGDNLW